MRSSCSSPVSSWEAAAAAARAAASTSSATDKSSRCNSSTVAPPPTPPVPPSRAIAIALFSSCTAVPLSPEERAAETWLEHDMSARESSQRREQARIRSRCVCRRRRVAVAVSVARTVLLLRATKEALLSTTAASRSLIVCNCHEGAVSLGV